MVSDTDSLNSQYPFVAISPVNGDSVIVYRQYNFDGSLWGISASLYGADGTAKKTNWRVNTQVTQTQTYPSVAYRPDGKFIVVWVDLKDTEQVKGKIYDADGYNPTDEIVISEDGNTDQPGVVSLSDNKMVVVWVRNHEKIYVRIVNEDGSMSGQQMLVNNALARTNYHTRISKFTDIDEVVVAFYSSYDTYGSRLDSEGNEVNYYGKMVNNQGKRPTIVAYSSDDIQLFATKKTNEFFAQEWTDGISGTSLIIDTNTNYGSADRGRDNIAVSSWLFNATDIRSMVLTKTNAPVSSAFDVSQTTGSKEVYIAADDVQYSITWESDTTIYWAKYELKYPKYVSGLGGLLLDENEAFDFTFAFEDPEAIGITFTLTDANGDTPPSWIHHDGSTSTEIYGTAPDITGCEETFNFKVTTSKSCQITETKEFSITVDDADPIVDQGIPNQTVAALTTGWSFTFNADAFSNVGALSYSAKLANGDELPSWLDFEDLNAREFTGDVPDQCEEILVIRVTATDDCSQIATTDFQLTVANTAPYNTKGLVDQSRVVDNTYEYIFDSGTYADDEGKSLAYTSDHLVGGGSFPAWLHFSEGGTKWYGDIPQEQCQEDFNVEIEVDDGCTIHTDSYTLSVTNQALTHPVQLDNQPTQANTLFEYTFDLGCFTDPEGLPLTYEAKLSTNDDPLPDWLKFEESNPRQFNGTVGAGECDGTKYVVKVVASDGCQANDVSGTYEIAITNNAPQQNDFIPNQEVHTNQLYTYTIPNTYFSDPEGVALTYEAQLNNGDPLPDWLKFEEDNPRQFKGTVDVGECENTPYNIDVTVSDGCQDNDVTENFVLTIRNDPPVKNIALLEGQVATTNQNYNYEFDDSHFSDPEGVTLAYEASLDDGTDLPGWLSFDGNFKQFSGKPYKTECDGEYYNIKVNASDGCDVAQDVFTITIENQVPTKNKGIPDQIVHNNKANYQYLIEENTFSDPESVELTYEAESDDDDTDLPDWLSFDKVNTKFYADRVPGDLCNGQYFLLKVIANDTCSAANGIFRITISNDPPYVQTALQDKTQAVNSHFSYVFNSDSFVDPEGVELTYTAELDSGEELPTWLSFNKKKRTFSGDIPEDTECNTSWDIKVTANDSCNSVSDVFKLTVSDDPPYVHEPLINQTNYAANPFKYQFLSTSFVDPENVQLDFEAELYGSAQALPSWLSFDSASRTFSGDVPDDQCQELLHIKVTAKDACTFVESDFFLNLTNPIPIDNKILERQRTYTKEAFEYTIPEDAFTNEDGAPLNYTAKRDGDKDLPSWLQFYPDTRTFAIEANDDDRCSYIYEIFVTADDGCNNVTGVFDFELINKSPKLMGTLENRTMNVEDELEYQLPDDLFTDPEKERISLSASLPEDDGREWPDWLKFDESVGKFYGTALSCGRPYEIVVEGQDPCTSVASVSWFLTIQDQPPIKQRDLVNQTFYVKIFNEYTFDEETFKDPDEKDLRYEAKMHDGSSLPSWLKFDSDSRTFTGTPSGCSQIILIDVAAIDPCTTSITTTFQIEIINSPIFVKLGLKDAQQEGNTFFDYTIDGLAFDDEDYEHEDYEYTAEMANGDPLPEWLEFRSNERRFIGDTPNENAEFQIRVYASDNCRSYNVSDTFTIEVTEAAASKDTEDNTALTQGLTVGVILLSIAVVASLFAFVLYRNHLKKKYERLWDGKQEFFTATMPKKSPLDDNNSANDSDVEMKDMKRSSDSSETSSSNHRDQQDLNKQEHFEKKNDDDVKSDIEVSDMSNESDLEDTNTDTSCSDSSLNSTSSNSSKDSSDDTENDI
ncbi:dystroglycan-related [Anaeramoeba flamelloides]|uniref:Dystroglycan-related n=1 Tax=Anaeramoeba flamelloides TaxID=1746091 RepID=A0ABQ8YSC3_9EUKA|nr:dystroglycan-related [Anaeramoeba flamelloides]